MMFRKSCAIRKVLLGLIMLMSVFVIYFIYAGDLQLIGSTSVAKIQERHDASGGRKFKYSSNNIFKTILGIKHKNCRLSNQDGSNGRRLKCGQLAMCNAIKTPESDLPATCKRRLPGCIIIGVFKAGTREFLDFLAMHPSIVTLRIPLYEIAFFVDGRWKKGLEWYRSAMPYSMQGQITMEKSPHYYTDADVPERIHQMNPNIKLILLVRDPVERTLSHLTFSPRKTLNRSLEFIYNITTQQMPDPTHTMQYSFYDKPFERYLRYFNRSQIHVVGSDEFKLKPYEVMRETEMFLGIPHLIQRDDFIFNDDKGFYCLKDVGNTISTCFGDERGRQTKRKDLGIIKPVLRTLFKPHNERFFKLVGRRFQWQ